MGLVVGPHFPADIALSALAFAPADRSEETEGGGFTALNQILYFPTCVYQSPGHN